MTVKGCGEPQHKNQIMVFQSIHLMTMCQNQSGGIWDWQWLHFGSFNCNIVQDWEAFVISCTQPITNFQAWKLCYLVSLASSFHYQAVATPNHLSLADLVHEQFVQELLLLPSIAGWPCTKTNVTKHKTDSFPQHRFYLILNIKA